MSTPTSSFDDRTSDEAAALRGDGDGAKEEGNSPSTSQQLRGRADEALRRFGTSTQDVEELVEQGRQAAARATDYVRTKPLLAIGIAAGVGLLAGLLTRRRH